jgi:ubiquinone/menaquinone biosynthesis C-methylase UbiE
MKLGVVPENVVERLALASGVVPTPLMLGFWGMGLSRVLIAAVRLGVFEALRDGERTSAELASALGVSQAGLEPLLHGLNGFGYLRRRGGRYRLARPASRWLLAGGKQSLRDVFLFFGDVWDFYADLEERIRTGASPNLHHAGRPPEFWERYLRGLATMAAQVGPLIARQVPLRAGAQSVLDVGGGHGLYSAALCRRHPELRATVLDLPEACRVGRAVVAEAGMSDRVRYVEGRLEDADFGGPHDAVLIFNVIHNLSREESRRALRRAFEALRPGGTVAVLESEHVESGGNVSTAGGFNELFFFLTSGTQAYPEAEMKAWMAEAGLEGVRRRALLGMPAVLLTGRRRPG